MKRSIIGLCAALAVFAVPVAAQASIEAGSYLGISNFVVTNTATGLPATVGVGGDISIALVTLTTASTDAVINGLPTSNFTLASLDAPASYSDGTTTVTPAGVENVFSPRPLPAGGPLYARGDTNAGAGSALSPAGGPVTTGASVDTIADVFVPNTATISNLGNSSATALQSVFILTITTPLTLTLDFDYLIDQTLDYTLPPSGLKLTSDSAFAASLIGVGVSVGGVTTGLFTYEPGELNTSYVRTSPGVTNPGDGTIGSLTSPEVTLAPGIYTFSITQGNSASISAVPEAASVVTWALMTATGAAFVAVRRRRLRN